MHLILQIENIIIAGCYLVIALLVGHDLWRARSEGVSMLGVATFGIFLTCSIGHFIHAYEHAFLHMPANNLALICQPQASTYAAAQRPVGYLQLIADGITIIPATTFLALRRRYGLLAKGEGVILQYERIAQRHRERERHLQAYSAELEDQVLQRQQAETALQAANERLQAAMRDLEQRTIQISNLSELGAMLQSCSSISEACEVIGHYTRRLFPNQSGMLYLLSPDEKILQPTVWWGETDLSKQEFSPDSCWALRRGHLHSCIKSHNDLCCPHIALAPGYSSICVPLLAQRAVCGVLVLYITNVPELSTPTLETYTKLAGAMVDHIALALSNLKLQDTLREQAIRDSLTGLYNRRYMEEIFATEIRRAMRQGLYIGALLLDLDHFKHVNDTLGHQAGDAVLRAVGLALQEQMRASDIVCRYGGEEFLILVPNVSLDTAIERAEVIRGVISRLQIVYQGHLVGPITTSIGIAIFPRHGTLVNEVLQQADTALYQAKQRGRNCYVIAGAHQPQQSMLLLRPNEMDEPIS